MGVPIYKINFNHLYYFLTIAQEGTIVAASKKLHMTQPALSQQLKVLELDLGRELFDREGRHLVLNDFGVLVKDYATKIFRQSDEMIQALSSDQLRFSKTIMMGVVPWLPNNFLYEAIKPLLINPYLQIHTLEGDLELLTQKLLSGDIDMILADSPYSGKSRKVTSMRLLSEDIVCVAAKNLKLKGKFPKNLEDKRLLNFPGQCLSSDKVFQFLDRKKVDYELAGDLHALDLMLEVVERGAAVGFFPKSYIGPKVKAKTVKVLGNLEKLKFSYWAILSRDFSEQGILRDLVQELKKSTL